MENVKDIKTESNLDSAQYSNFYPRHSLNLSSTREEDLQRYNRSLLIRESN